MNDLKNLSVLKRARIILTLLENNSSMLPIQDYTPEELKLLRNFLEQEIIFLSTQRDSTPITLAEIKTHLEPATTYYYQQDCREPVSACINETCYTSNPACFSKKMVGQLEVLIKLLQPYFQDEESAPDE